MSNTQLLLCLYGICALFFNHVEAYRVRRMVGGDDAKEGRFTYQISLQFKGVNICGGSILSERFVITAAHCVMEGTRSFTGQSLKVVAGITDLRSNPVVVDVHEAFVHTDYKPTTLVQPIADIAILKLSKDLDFENNPRLSKIRLPEEDKTYEGISAVITGFGLNYVEVVKNQVTGEYKNVNGINYGKMRYAVASVLGLDDCQKIDGFSSITQAHICAAVKQRYSSKPEGTCDGDSGGPLVLNGVQIGVLSWGPHGCKEDKVPAVYTRVSKYVDFIKNVVEGKIDKSVLRVDL